MTLIQMIIQINIINQQTVLMNQSTDLKNKNIMEMNRHSGSLCVDNVHVSGSINKVIW